jgi:hypothetical protein
VEICYGLLFSGNERLGGAVEQNLIDMPGAAHYHKALSHSPTMREVPETTRETMRSLSHGLLVARQIRRLCVGAGVTQQDDNVPLQVPLSRAFVDVEAAHPDRIINGETGSMYHPLLAAMAPPTRGAAVSAR